MTIAEQKATYGFSWDEVEGFGPVLDFWTFYQEAVAAAPPNSTIVELGCYCGKSLTCLGLLAKAANKGLTIVGIDNNSCLKNPTCKANLLAAGLKDTVMFIEGDSAAAAAQFADKSCWMVFVDGGHLHDLVEADVRAWMPKVADNGWLAGHDFRMHTVHQPVIAMFEHVGYDARWLDIWFVPKCEPLVGVDIGIVPEKYPDFSVWNPRT